MLIVMFVYSSARLSACKVHGVQLPFEYNYIKYTSSYVEIINYLCHFSFFNYRPL